MMELQGSPEKPATKDYFAKRLLEKLPDSDPVSAAYEAQDISRQVGFDFADFDSVVPRALDEIRETKEALHEEGPEGRTHFGDEIADIMFSFVNLARHAGVKDLASIEHFTDEAHRLEVDERSVEDIVDELGESIEALAEVSQQNPEMLETATKEAFDSGMQKTTALAIREGFDPRDLLEENVRKYLVRCEAIEQLASEDDKSWSDLAQANEIITYWKRAKTLLQ